MTLGEVGCSLSHVLLWAEIAGGETPVLILEDDGPPGARAHAGVPRLMDDLAHIDWDVCWLAHRNDEGPKPLVGAPHPRRGLPPGVDARLHGSHPEGLRGCSLRRGTGVWCRPTSSCPPLLPATATACSTRPTALARQRHSPSPSSSGSLRPAPQSFTGSETEHSPAVREADAGMEAFAVATDETPGWQRLKVSALRYGVNLQPLGMGTRWKGGDMRGPGGGQKDQPPAPRTRRIAARAPRALP